MKIAKPNDTGTKKQDPAFPKNNHHIFLTTEDNTEILWSGATPLPEVGQAVTVTMNSIGKATVRGYIKADIWLGLIVYPLYPPEYLKKNIADAQKNPEAPPWRKEGCVIVYGTECKPIDQN